MKEVENHISGLFYISTCGGDGGGGSVVWVLMEPDIIVIKYVYTQY